MFLYSGLVLVGPGQTFRTHLGGEREDVQVETILAGSRVLIVTGLNTAGPESETDRRVTDGSDPKVLMVQTGPGSDWLPGLGGVPGPRPIGRLRCLEAERSYWWTGERDSEELDHCPPV